MNAFGKLLALLAGSWAAAGLLAADKKPNPQEKLETAIPEAIRLLKANEHLLFLQRFVPPDDLKKIGGGDGPNEETAKGFGVKKAPRLLAVLEAIGDTEPSMSEDETIATYKLSKPVGPGKDSISFVKVGKLWYLRN